jgi:hypothetical protein
MAFFSIGVCLLVLGAPSLPKKNNEIVRVLLRLGRRRFARLTGLACFLKSAQLRIEALSERTDEYFYRDVVSVSTQSKSKTYENAEIGKGLSEGLLKSMMIAGKLQFNAAEMFILTTSGGTSIEVVLRDPQLIERAGGGSIPTDMADKAVQTVRKMLREKKVAASA